MFRPRVEYVEQEEEDEPVPRPSGHYERAYYCYMGRRSVPQVMIASPSSLLNKNI